MTFLRISILASLFFVQGASKFVAQSADFGLTFNEDLNSLSTIESSWFGIDARYFCKNGIVASLGLVTAKNKTAFRAANNPDYNDPEVLANSSELSDWLKSAFPSTNNNTSPNRVFAIPISLAYAFGSERFLLSTGVFGVPRFYGNSLRYGSLGVKIEPNFKIKERYILSLSYSFAKLNNAIPLDPNYLSSFGLAVRYRFLIKHDNKFSDSN